MFGDIGKMLKMVSEMKQKMPQVQERIANSRFTAHAGEGLVAATVSGKMVLVDLQFSPAAGGADLAPWLS